MNGYELSKIWYSFCAENSDRVNPNHHALFFWIVEKANTLQWPQNFGLPTDEAMHFLGISTYRTYIKALRELIDFEMIELVEESKNQYTANRVCFGKKVQSTIKSKAEAEAKAKSKAKSKAEQKQSQKQSDYNKTLETLETNETINNKNRETDSDISDKVFDFDLDGKKAPQTGPEILFYDFDEAFELYQYHGAEEISMRLYEGLDVEELTKIYNHLIPYIKATPDIKYRKKFDNYLKDKTYNDPIIEHGSSSRKNNLRPTGVEPPKVRSNLTLDEVLERARNKHT